jgi:3-phenylpropionate/trans-cinnamate dioxygenase ferredoxin reductase subunit
VVGGGIGGLEALVALRGQGYRGVLTLVAAERHLPYDRPPLSKEVLRGETSDTELEADWEELNVELRLATHATGLSPGVLHTDAGDLDFDGLVIATGAQPVELPASPGADTHLLRSVDDALALRERLALGGQLVIVGAGWIGAELATAAAESGCSVTVVEAAEAPLAAALPPALGSLTLPWYAEAGVDLRVGEAVAALEPGAVHLAGGGELAADCVVVGVGARPSTAWLAGSDVALDDRGRVLADSALRTSVPGVVAVGDCAAWESERYGKRLHVEHWDNALRAPEVAAGTLLGTEATYDPVPYFWCEQFGHMMQYVGHHEPTDALFLREDPSQPGWTACWLRGERLVALLAVDRARDLAQGRRVIGDGHAVDAERLLSPETPLMEAVAS